MWLNVVPLITQRLCEEELHEEIRKSIVRILRTDV